jgi:hypothetical protein
MAARPSSVTASRMSFSRGGTRGFDTTFEDIEYEPKSPEQLLNMLIANPTFNLSGEDHRTLYQYTYIL